jgi:hypothetical protein
MKLARCATSSLLLLLLAACSVDDRQLSTGVGGGGGSGSESPVDMGGGDDDAPNGNGAAPADGGEPGAGLVEGCADLDTDGVPDCTTTLVETPTFTEDVGGWVALEGTKLTWDAKNALGDSPSGSAKLTTASPRAGAAQCVPLSGERLVIAYAQALAEPGEDTEGSTSLLVQVSFYGAKDCEGEPLSSFETPPSTEDGVWTTVQAGSVSAKDTRSLSVTLMALRPEGGAGLVVYFDNVMLKTQELD